MTKEKFPNELEYIKSLFSIGKSTLEVKNYLIDKYGVSGGACAKIIKAARKNMGIYHSNKDTING